MRSLHNLSPQETPSLPYHSSTCTAADTRNARHICLAGARFSTDRLEPRWQGRIVSSRTLCCTTPAQAATRQDRMGDRLDGMASRAGESGPNCGVRGAAISRRRPSSRARQLSSPLHRDRKFESISLQRRVSCEPEEDIEFRIWRRPSIAEHRVQPAGADDGPSRSLGDRSPGNSPCL
jgi:hypothetical protein